MREATLKITLCKHGERALADCGWHVHHAFICLHEDEFEWSFGDVDPGRWGDDWQHTAYGLELKCHHCGQTNSIEVLSDTGRLKPIEPIANMMEPTKH